MKMVLLLKNLACANCAAKIERNVSKIDGVKGASVNFITSKLILEISDGMESEIEEKAKKIAVKTEPQIVVSRA
jgi:copper chaperone CopZ